MVTVYHFKVWDQQQGEYIIQPLKSPADRIQEIGGKIIPGTAENVDVSALDSEGRYDPKSQSEKPDTQKP